MTHIADAGPFIGKALLDPANAYHRTKLDLTNKYGNLRPDFLCLTSQNEAVLVESKGAIGLPSAIPKSEKLKAKQQVGNVQPVGVKLRSTENRLVIASNIRVESDISPSAKTDSGAHVIDPEGNDLALSVPASEDQIVINSYCKVLQFSGLGPAAFFFDRGLRPLFPNLQDGPQEAINNERIVPIALLFGMRVCLLAQVCDAVFNEPKQGVARRVAGVLQDSSLIRLTRERPRPEMLVLPNGVVLLPMDG